MALNTKDFTTLVKEMVASVQAGATAIIDFSVGSIMLAWTEAVAFVAVWLQSIVLQLLLLVRAATSTGSDLDSWMADFGLVRIDAVAASGLATFSRASTAMAATIPLGATIASQDGSKQYLVILDVTNPAYSAGVGGYILPIGTASITLPIVAINPGAYSNAAIGEISLLTTAIAGVDTVANAATIDNGMDTETDAQFRARFVLTIQTYGRATLAAVQGATAPILPGIRYSVVENSNFDGTPNDGYFYVVVDDGTGHPSPAVITSVQAAIDQVRPLTSAFGVFAPQVVPVAITFDIVTDPLLSHSALVLAAQAAVTSFVNSLGLGAALPFTMISKVAYETDPGILNVQNVAVNSTTFDVVPSQSQVLKVGTVVVN